MAKLYYYLFILIAILWNIMIGECYAQSPLPEPQATKIPEQLLEFNIISVRGAIEVDIEQVPESEPNFFLIKGEQKTPVSVSVRDNTLYLQGEESGQPTPVTVGLHQLSHLMVDGSASIRSRNLTTSNPLSIDANTTGAIELSGMINLDRILSANKGPIRIQWIDSPRLRIDGSGNSQIQLAGVANTVEMRLRDESQFQGQYLRIDRIFVQTKDYSVAKLLVNDSLRAFAYDHSNIYYYKRPDELTEFTAGSGNILQLGWGQ